MTVTPEDFHGGLCVRIVGWFEAELLEAHALKERMQSAYEVTQCQAPIADEALDLVELSQMRPVYVFIAEHAVNRKVLGRLETLLSKAVQHA